MIWEKCVKMLKFQLGLLCDFCMDEMINNHTNLVYIEQPSI